MSSEYQDVEKNLREMRIVILRRKAQERRERMAIMGNALALHGL
jgi:hypothetical protein